MIEAFYFGSLIREIAVYWKVACWKFNCTFKIIHRWKVLLILFFIYMSLSLNPITIASQGNESRDENVSINNYISISAKNRVLFKDYVNDLASVKVEGVRIVGAVS